jgi:hypothetical protein
VDIKPVFDILYAVVGNAVTGNCFEGKNNRGRFFLFYLRRRNEGMRRINRISAVEGNAVFNSLELEA